MSHTNNTSNNNTSKKVVNVLTAENFTLAAGVGDYAMKTASGDVTFKVTDKKSNFGSGKLTVYTVTTADGKTHTDKPVGYYKKMFGAIVNHRDTTATTTAKVHTEEEITNKVMTFTADLAAAIDRLDKVVGRCLVDTADVIAQVRAAIPSDLPEAYRAELVRRNEEAKTAAAAAQKAAQDRADKAAAKEAAAQVQSLDAANVAALKALMAAGVDLTKIAADLAAKTA